MDARPRILDLFSGAGGAARGYQMAGFHVTGIDIKPQPRYAGDVFIQGDALDYCRAHGHEYDAIHASPPCHEYSTGTRHRKNIGIVYPDLLPATQSALRDLGLPYVIENVPGAAALMLHPVLLCGGMFDLGVMRHRYFESNAPIEAPLHTCNGQAIDRDLVSVTRHGPPARWYRKNPGRSFDISIWHRAMGIDWMTRLPLTQAIPPAYTHHIGLQLLAAIRNEVAA